MQNVLHHLTRSASKHFQSLSFKPFSKLVVTDLKPRLKDSVKKMLPKACVEKLKMKRIKRSLYLFLFEGRREGKSEKISWPDSQLGFRIK